MQLPAWAIALGYKHRWDLEKIFDQFTNKMAETKSWASSTSAKESHALFECLAHNLSLLLEEGIIKEEGLRDTREEKRREEPGKKFKRATPSSVKVSSERARGQ